MNEVNEASPASKTSDVERVVICPVCYLPVEVQMVAHVFRRTSKGREFCLHSDCLDDVALNTVGLDEITKGI